MNKYIVCSVLIVVLCVLLNYCSHYLPNFSNYFINKTHKSKKLFTPQELQLYNGIESSELYLAILGNVFDVTKGGKHYGPEGTYNVFIGRDASRSFITGKFSADEASDDLMGLSRQEVQSLKKWLAFYEQEYKNVGKVIGRYYDSSGKRTPYYKEILKIIKLTERESEAEMIEKMKFPPCNVEWNIEHGSRVWCTNRSGGIERNWVGVPRKFYEPGSDTYRCACVKDEDRNSKLISQYEGCDPNLETCQVII